MAARRAFSASRRRRASPTVYRPRDLRCLSVGVAVLDGGTAAVLLRVPDAVGRAGVDVAVAPVVLVAQRRTALARHLLELGRDGLACLLRAAPVRLVERQRYVARKVTSEPDAHPLVCEQHWVLELVHGTPVVGPLGRWRLPVVRTVRHRPASRMKARRTKPARVARASACRSRSLRPCKPRGCSCRAGRDSPWPGRTASSCAGRRDVLRSARPECPPRHRASW